MDFLSNGFQQLFAELDNNNQQNLTEKEYTFEFQYNTFENFYDYQFNNPSDNYNLFGNEHNNSEMTSSSNSSKKSEFTNNYENPGIVHNEAHFTVEENIFSSVFDWENQFLENYIELPDFVNLLPEKTLLCSESCDLFLKESSENLKKFHQNSNSINTKNDDEISSNNIENNISNKAVMHLTTSFYSNNKINDNCIKSSFPCTWESCKKVYAKPAHLKAHLRRHLGDKPYICNWPDCTWRFSRSDELARHKRSHSGIKPFECIYCPKCFARSDHLAKHRKVHERKMAASKLKGIYIPNLHQVRPGRKPKNCQFY